MRVARRSGGPQHRPERLRPEVRRVMAVTLHRMTDDEAMVLALEEAALALDHDDVPVGAVALVDGDVIARRHNERETRNDPTAHAELLVLQDAASALGT